MFTLPEDLLRLLKSFSSVSSSTELLGLHLAGGTQQMESSYSSCFEHPFAHCILPQLLAEVKVTSFECFQKNALPRLGIHGCLVELRHQGLGHTDFNKDVSSSRGVTGYTESCVAIEKPLKLTPLYPIMPCSFSEKETASGTFSVSISHHKNPAPSSAPKRKNQMKSWLLPNNLKSSYMTKLLNRHPNSKAQGNLSQHFL